MSEIRAADEHAIREQAYYFWEQDGRPHGRASEYWTRAVNAVSGKPTGAAKRSAKLQAAASKASTAPAKSAKPSISKPKKK
jgi:DUF2934 family protein